MERLGTLADVAGSLLLPMLGYCGLDSRQFSNIGFNAARGYLGPISEVINGTRCKLTSYPSIFFLDCCHLAPNLFQVTSIPHY